MSANLGFTYFLTCLNLLLGLVICIYTDLSGENQFEDEWVEHSRPNQYKHTFVLDAAINFKSVRSSWLKPLPNSLRKSYMTPQEERLNDRRDTIDDSRCLVAGIPLDIFVRIEYAENWQAADWFPNERELEKMGLSEFDQK